MISKAEKRKKSLADQSNFFHKTIGIRFLAQCRNCTILNTWFDSCPIKKFGLRHNRAFHLSLWNFLPKAESELTALGSFFFGLFIYLFFSDGSKIF